MVICIWKYPNNKNIKTKTFFNICIIKVLPFLVAFDDYNHFINAVDLRNQLEIYFELFFKFYKHWKLFFK